MSISKLFRCRLDPGAGYIIATVLVLGAFVSCEMATANHVVMEGPIEQLPDCPACVCPVPACPSTSSAPSADGSPVDLNRATQQELEALPGIGPGMAQRIIQHRSGRPFRRTRDLLRVRGVGPRTYRQLAPLITVGTE